MEEKEVAAQMGISVRSLRRMLANTVLKCDTCGAMMKWSEQQTDGCPVCKETDEATPEESVDAN